MKKLNVIAFFIINIFLSQVSSAGSITDAYTTGHILTAQKMNNIKTEINDNNTRTGSNENIVTAITTSILTNVLRRKS